MELLRTFIQSLSPVPEPDFALLTPYLRAQKVPKGTHVLEAGRVCEAVYFVNTGLLRMYYVGPDGHEVNCRFAGAAGFLTDYQSFLTQQPSRYFWQALQPAEVLVLPYALVQRLYRESAAWDHFGRLMAERVYQQLNERVELLQFLTPTQRYQHLQQHQPELLTQVSQAHLASYLGVQPESLSRIRHRLSQK
ncbi:Crp/Fnr family transcriptional regulator [Hymenobacter sp. PAMC 26628]|uniref:Crp/Fnr family transcriptional regulator n=1 Tax=Hymenobacter sp. PAMC 26628 TaxID=1484118 RepID=UPI00077045A0|nr:Crp/Fnr family transcriptional regulator [Hymenobacter sp. PAMC 26628]AMJ67792.1 Crp/Fnr family transcriptional regulator [Hymenobacter sp. PAMC 26628]